MPKELITWTDKYSIDKGLIDKQHKVLVDLINELYFAFLEGKANDNLSKIIAELIKYTKTHFQDEENIFAKSGYPEVKAHKQKHEGFVRKVEKFKNDLDSGKLSVSYEIMNFLRDWLLNHILVSDREFLPYLK